MNGLGGLNKSPSGVVIGLVQLKLPVIEARSNIAAQTDKIVAMVAKAKRGMSTIDLVVFPSTRSMAYRWTYAMKSCAISTARRWRRSRLHVLNTRFGAASRSWSVIPAACLTTPA